MSCVVYCGIVFRIIFLHIIYVVHWRLSLLPRSRGCSMSLFNDSSMTLQSMFDWFNGDLSSCDTLISLESPYNNYK